MGLHHSFTIFQAKNMVQARLEDYRDTDCVNDDLERLGLTVWLCQ